METWVTLKRNSAKTFLKSQYNVPRFFLQHQDIEEEKTD